tara:strand:+ start:5450 stop:6097 length:648 start_codon:yes stop_codon:yes gene_type:complete
MESLTNSLPTTKFTKDLMNKIDRKDFVMNKKKSYIDQPQPLIQKQTISAPHMHARAIEYMESVLKPGSSILDIGSGSGYLSACYAEAVKVYHKDIQKRGTVIGIDIFPDLVNYSKKCIQDQYNHFNTYKKNFKLLIGDGKLGYPKSNKKEKYDGIHIGAACDFIPNILLSQLKKNGILLLPLKINNNLFFTVVQKDKKGNLSLFIKESVRYVPLL